VTTDGDDELWSAISEPSRQLVLDLLVRNAPTTASWLAGQVPFSRQAVSKHLVVLEHVGLIRRQKQGREVQYRVDPERLDAATRQLSRLATEWDRRLSEIKRIAEAAHAQSSHEPDQPASRI
jgi:DNA-binding transcriptional ArsR family regulator